MYRIVTSDIDQRLLDGNRAVPQTNVDATCETCALGSHSLAGSSRFHSSIMESFERVTYGLLVGSYLIGCSGCLINHIGNDRFFARRALFYEKVLAFFRASSPNDGEILSEVVERLV